jgi:hypothetical protein
MAVAARATKGAAVNAVIKPKKCRACNRPFTPRLTTQMCCSASCAISYSRAWGEKRQSQAMKRVAAAEKRERRIALKTRKDWVREAQAVFNAWVRERDHLQPCISCGSHVPDGYWDAGHYRSVGAAPELRFEPLNCHKQCKSCNGTTIHKRGYTHPLERQLSVRDRYRANLIERIGLQQVEWLESYHEPLKPSIEWLREKIVEWRKETRRMREARGARQVG